MVRAGGGAAFARRFSGGVPIKQATPDGKGPRPVMLIDHQTGEQSVAVIVTVTNDGGQLAHVNGVYLHGGGVVGRLTRGPVRRVEIGPRGDKRTWMFDYTGLREQLAEQARTEFRDPNAPMMIRATVHNGKNVLRSNAVQVNPPGVATAHQTRRDRWRRFHQSWRRPYPMNPWRSFPKRRRHFATTLRDPQQW